MGLDGMGWMGWDEMGSYEIQSQLDVDGTVVHGLLRVVRRTGYWLIFFQCRPVWADTLTNEVDGRTQT